MHDAERATIDADAVVRVVQARRGAGDHGEDDAERDLPAQRARALEQATHGLAVHVLHGEEERIAELSDVEHLRDVRVLELGRESGLFQEHLDEVVVVRLVADDPLEHHVALHTRGARTPGEKDLRHPTGRELREDLIVVRGRSDLGDNGWHVPAIVRCLPR